MKRTPLRRKTPLRSSGGLRRARRDPRDVGPADAEIGSRMNGPVGEPRDRSPAPRSAYRSRPRDTDYMLWVKRQPCLMRGVWGSCEGRVEADHAGRRGVGRKAHDSTCIPLCHRHHQASRFPRAWTQDQRRDWLHAAVVYTQACARAAGIEVPDDPAPMTEYPATPPRDAWAVLAEVASAATRAAAAAVGCHGGKTA